MAYKGSKSSYWSKPGKLERLKTLWETGLTASEIADELGEGISRSAICGKADRLGLSERSRGRNHRPHKTKKRSVRAGTASEHRIASGSNLPALIMAEQQKVAQKPKVSFLGSPEKNYPFGHKLSPFPEPEYGDRGFTFADIKALESLYV